MAYNTIQLDICELAVCKFVCVCVCMGRKR